MVGGIIIGLVAGFLIGCYYSNHEWVKIINIYKDTIKIYDDIIDGYKNRIQ